MDQVPLKPGREFVKEVRDELLKPGFNSFGLGDCKAPKPMVTPETLPMHPVRELQERRQQQAEGLEYKATRNGNLATVEVYIVGLQIGSAQNPQK
ncbi:hypothetical protein IFM89_000529 [Coptis chinensis]|uniref:Uncharacterized protein n=1 Tax=Coptis chinensis TaxID=261450 RepID=A0A835H0U9_9MAGN|nr:hypothetical protein IFM89_000529 [Coptis chinensis]